MKSFFNAILILSAFVVAGTVYYGLRNRLRIFKAKRSQRLIQNRESEERIRANASAIREFLEGLQHEKIYWLEIIPDQRPEKGIFIELDKNSRWFYIKFIASDAGNLAGALLWNENDPSQIMRTSRAGLLIDGNEAAFDLIMQWIVKVCEISADSRFHFNHK